jgi:HAE1 family hydrophobic/amphiphilic exporter-1/multidrug efflux pump
LAPGKSISDGIEAMEEIRAKVLDDTLPQIWVENLEISKVVQILAFAFGLALLLIFFNFGCSV